jgi:hypothetical protein
MNPAVIVIGMVDHGDDHGVAFRGVASVCDHVQQRNAGRDEVRGQRNQREQGVPAKHVGDGGLHGPRS